MTSRCVRMLPAVTLRFLRKISRKSRIFGGAVLHSKPPRSTPRARRRKTFFQIRYSLRYSTFVSFANFVVRKSLVECRSVIIDRPENLREPQKFSNTVVRRIDA